MEQREKESLNNYANTIISFYRNVIIKLIDKDKKIHYTTKGKGKSEYGYYITEYPSNLVDLLSKYGVKNLVDLGSGAGILLYILKRFTYNIKYTGFEREVKLINFANKYLDVDTKRKNLLKLTKEDLKYFDCLYFWEPIYDKDLARVFVDCLVKSMYPGQLIIYKCSGIIGTHIINSKEFEQLENSNYFVFKKL